VGDQEGVFGIDDHEMIHDHEGDKFAGAEDIVVAGVKGQQAAEKTANSQP
jgi:hypothetical protein